MSPENTPLQTALNDTEAVIDRALADHTPEFAVQQIGAIRHIGHGIAQVDGLGGAKSEELLRFPGGIMGMVFNLDPDAIGVVLLGNEQGLAAGQQVQRTGRVLDIGVGDAFLGRIISPLGRPLDNCGPIRAALRLPIERPAPPIMHRRPVNTPLQTGIKVIDATIPIGRGQRELILGDRQTGKTAIALDTLLNQRDQDVICIYCAIGQRSSAVAKLIAELQARHALDYCVVMVALGEEPPGLQFIAPYAATTLGEYFMAQGRDVLVIYDDLTRHAWAYRELSLLLRRPPGREAFPGDIFYLHSRLLERATALRPEVGGGTLTALPIVETEAQNMAGYIPTNIISITDGQIYLSPDLFQKGLLPAVDVGKSVSRVGGAAQLPAYRAISGDLRLTYSQFEELEAFARFGTRLDMETRRTIEHGRRVREILKQPQYAPVPVAAQIAVLLAMTQHAFDAVPVDQVIAAEQAVRAAVLADLPDLCRSLEAGNALTAELRAALLAHARTALAAFAAPAA